MSAGRPTSTPWPRSSSDPPGWCGSSTGCPAAAGGVAARAARRGRRGRVGPGHGPQGLRPAAADRLRDDLRAGQHRLQRLDRSSAPRSTRAPTRCPPGSFTAGWWKAADSSWCGGGYRYIVDCNAKCTKCTSGCTDHICDSEVLELLVHARVHRHVRPAGTAATRSGTASATPRSSAAGVCTAASCRAWRRTSGTTARPPRSAATPPPSTARPTCRAWGPMEQLYTAMGGQRSYLGASTGPIRSTMDGTASTSTTPGGASGRRAPPAVAMRRSSQRVQRLRRALAPGLPQGSAHHRPDRRWVDPALPERGHGRQRVDHDPLRARLPLGEVARTAAARTGR